MHLYLPKICVGKFSPNVKATFLKKKLVKINNSPSAIEIFSNISPFRNLHCSFLLTTTYVLIYFSFYFCRNPSPDVTKSLFETLKKCYGNKKNAYKKANKSGTSKSDSRDNGKRSKILYIFLLG